MKINGCKIANRWIMLYRSCCCFNPLFLEYTEIKQDNSSGPFAYAKV